MVTTSVLVNEIRGAYERWQLVASQLCNNSAWSPAADRIVDDYIRNADMLYNVATTPSSQVVTQITKSEERRRQSAEMTAALALEKGDAPSGELEMSQHRATSAALALSAESIANELRTTLTKVLSWRQLSSARVTELIQILDYWDLRLQLRLASPFKQSLETLAQQLVEDTVNERLPLMVKRGTEMVLIQARQQAKRSARVAFIAAAMALLFAVVAAALTKQSINDHAKEIALSKQKIGEQTARAETLAGKLNGLTGIKDELDKKIDGIGQSLSQVQSLTRDLDEIVRDKKSGLQVAIDDDKTGLRKRVSNLEALRRELDDLKTTVGDDSSGLRKELNDLKSIVGNEKSGLKKIVNDMRAVVGDDTSGLKKELSDVKAVIGNDKAGLRKDMSDVKAAVGDDKVGLRKDLSDLKAVIGNDKAGLKKDLSDVKAAVGDDKAGLKKDLIDLRSSLNDLKVVVGDDNSGLKKDVADLKAKVH